MAYGILFFRVVLGLVLAGHGSQKLFGWFGGGGPRETAGSFESLGFRRPTLLAVSAGLAESSGVAFALGFLTPLAAAAIASVMVVAAGSVHIRNGFWITKGGFEYNLVIWTAAVAVAATGPGRFSIDRALGWDGSLSGLWWGLGAIAASLAGGLIVLATRVVPAEQAAADEPIARESNAPARSAYAEPR